MMRIIYDSKSGITKSELFTKYNYHKPIIDEMIREKIILVNKKGKLKLDYRIERELPQFKSYENLFQVWTNHMKWVDYSKKSDQ